MFSLKIDCLFIKRECKDEATPPPAKRTPRRRVTVDKMKIRTKRHKDVNLGYCCRTVIET